MVTGSNAETIAILKRARADLRVVHKAMATIDGGIADKIWNAMSDVEDRLGRELLRRELADA